MPEYTYLGIIFLVGIAVWVSVGAVYTAGAANFSLFVYALLTIRLYQLLDRAERAVSRRLAA